MYSQDAPKVTCMIRTLLRLRNRTAIRVFGLTPARNELKTCRVCGRSPAFHKSQRLLSDSPAVVVRDYCAGSKNGRRSWIPFGALRHSGLGKRTLENIYCLNNPLFLAVLPSDFLPLSHVFPCNHSKQLDFAAYQRLSVSDG